MLNTVLDGTANGPRSPSPADAYRAALAHSRKVRRLKILLPVAAVVVTLAFFSVSIIRAFLPENISISSAKIENGKVVMEKPAIAGVNADGISYSMKAERALQDIKDPNVITLEDIVAAVPVKDASVARVTAQEGIYNRAANTLDMVKPFTIRLDDKVEANFQSADLDIKAGTMATDLPVRIQAQQALIVAQALKITDKGRIVVFEGNVRVNVNPEAIRNQVNREPGKS